MHTTTGISTRRMTLSIVFSAISIVMLFPLKITWTFAFFLCAIAGLALAIFARVRANAYNALITGDQPFDSATAEQMSKSVRVLDLTSFGLSLAAFIVMCALTFLTCALACSLMTSAM
nr:hypothetical protein [Maliibacterium massiliense]